MIDLKNNTSPHTLQCENNLSINFINYSTGEFTVPAVRHDSKAKKANVLTTGLALFFALLGQDTTDALDEKIFSMKKIPFIRLTTYNNDYKYIISSDDARIILEAMNCANKSRSKVSKTKYEKACLELYETYENNHTEQSSKTYSFLRNFYMPTSRPEHDILFGCLKNSDKIITVTSTDKTLDTIKTNLEAYEKEIQRKKEKEKKENQEKRQKLLKSISESVDFFSKQIVDDFNKTGLLKTNLLTSREKVNEYKAIREFCIEYIPELSDAQFDLNSLLKKHRDYIKGPDLNLFSKNWENITKSYLTLKKGLMGEDKVSEVLELFNDRIHILRNYTERYEHDFIIISPYGIYTIEVKNLYGEHILTETGILKSLTGPKSDHKDVALQSKKHIESLRKLLNNCSYYNSKIPINEIICSANSDFTITNKYSFLPVCYYNTIDKYVLPESAPVIMTPEVMSEIYNFLIENQAQEYKYDVFLPHGEISSKEEFINSFAAIAAGLMSKKNIKSNTST